RVRLAVGGRLQRPGLERGAVRRGRHLRGRGLRRVRHPRRHARVPRRQRLQGRRVDDAVHQRQLERRGRAGATARPRVDLRRRRGGGLLRAVVDGWKGRGSPIDFTNPDAVAWFQARLHALVDASGGVIGGFKTDDGESDFIPATASYFDGRTGAEMKNGYSVAYHGAVHDVLGDAGVLWSRSGFTGTGAFPAQWAGDNEPNFGA